jgi:glutamate synthase (NADPH) small chain
MGKATGFTEYERVEVGHRPIPERIRDWHEIDRPLVARTLTEQAARCMDCGIPYCHAVGCPVKNRIPEFNDLVYRNRWREAAENLHSTNNFPEITGRVCPAPCEAACTLALNDDAVTIKHIEYQIAERAFKEDWVQPLKPKARTGHSVAVIGSGPAGLAAAQQLTRLGHQVTLFEKDDRLGGLLRYGIPDFKMEKQVIDRRLEQMVAEGLQCEPNVAAGVDITGAELRSRFDAVVLCMGAGKARPLDVPGGDLAGVHLAMDYLTQQNRRVAGDAVPEKGSGVFSPNRPESNLHKRLPTPFPINAKGKNVIVVGGGDTGSDCVGTAIRQGALSVRQLEILPRPPEGKNAETPWPNWPRIMRTSSSQEEGCQRHWSALTKALVGANGQVTHLAGCEIDWVSGPKGWEMKELPGTDFTFPADLVLIAMGFLHVVHEGLLEQLGIDIDRRGNVVVDRWMTTAPGVFAAGDTVRGASLVVHAINHGRLAAAAVDKWLRANARR